MKYLSVLFILIFYVSDACSQNIATGKSVIEYLADDKLEGRYPGTNGGEMARQYIDQMFYDDWMNKYSFGYQQKFTIQTNIALNDHTKLTFNGKEGRMSKDFHPLAFSAENSEKAGVIYCGTSLKDTELDINNQWALIYIKLN